MKLWRFFKKEVDSDNIDDGVERDVSTKYPLYATTTDKNKAKVFMKQRNMDVFIVRVSDIERDEYLEYMQGVRGTDIIEKELVTVKNKYTDKMKEMYVNMMVTMNEKVVIEEPYFLQEQDWWLFEAPSPLIFNKSIQKALKMLDYNILFKLFTNESLPEFDEDDDIPAPAWLYDDVGVFISICGDTLKIED